MDKLIINNQTNFSMAVVLETMILPVMKRGRISNYGKEYCYFTLIDTDAGEYAVASDKNKASDRLTVYKYKGEK